MVRSWVCDYWASVNMKFRSVHLIILSDSLKRNSLRVLERSPHSIVFCVIWIISSDLPFFVDIMKTRIMQIFPTFFVEVKSVLTEMSLHNPSQSSDLFPQ